MEMVDTEVILTTTMIIVIIHHPQKSLSVDWHEACAVRHPLFCLPYPYFESNMDNYWTLRSVVPKIIVPCPIFKTRQSRVMVDEVDVMESPTVYIE